MFWQEFRENVSLMCFPLNPDSCVAYLIFIIIITPVEIPNPFLSVNCVDIRQFRHVELQVAY